MRVRLLIDSLISESEVPDLAELIADQPVVVIDGLEGLIRGGRFVGAQVVHGDGAQDTPAAP